ncbi:MAG: hypothetical protein WBF14_07145, partial [Candidatus Acidiferrales bacterium]
NRTCSRPTGSNPFHPARGPLPAILPLFPRRFQLPIPLDLNPMPMPGEHVLWREVAVRAGLSEGISGGAVTGA